MAKNKRLSAEWLNQIKLLFTNEPVRGPVDELFDEISALLTEIALLKIQRDNVSSREKFRLENLSQLRAENARLRAALEQAILDSSEINGQKSIEHSGVLSIEQALESTSDEALRAIRGLLSTSREFVNDYELGDKNYQYYAELIKRLFGGEK